MQRNIPAVYRYVALLLEFIGQSNEFWFAQVRAFTKKCEAAIVVGTAHAETVPVAIKSDKRSEHQVKVAWFYEPAPFRFRDAIAIENQAFTGLEAGKPQFSVRKRGNDREIDLFSQLPKPLNQWKRVNFTVTGEVRGNMLAVSAKSAITNELRQLFGAMSGFLQTDGSSPVAKGVA